MDERIFQGEIVNGDIELLPGAPLYYSRTTAIGCEQPKTTNGDATCCDTYLLEDCSKLVKAADSNQRNSSIRVRLLENSMGQCLESTTSKGSRTHELAHD